MKFELRSHARRVRRVSHALGCSVLAIAAASPAWAACSPDAVAFGGTVTCDQSDADGLIVSTTATVRVQPGAQVQAGADAAIRSTSGYLTLVNNGTISGGARPGVLINQAGDITVGANGSVTGSAAILLHSIGSQVFANVDNSGQLIGTAGAALVADPGTFFNILRNAPNAMIGGVAGHVNFLNNSGTIDGGAQSAIAMTVFNQTGGNVGNTGTIRASSTEATMDLGSRVLSDNTIFDNGVTNSGLIENGGAGTAITSNGNIMVANLSGGRIASGGGAAIRTAGSLRLTSAGTIVGSVISTAGGGNGSSVDTTAGTIQGDLLLGAGDDVLAAVFDFTTGRIGSVTGLVDGGGGTDTVVARIADNMTIAAITLPTNFEKLQIDLADGAAVTISDGTSFPQGFGLGGNGKLTVADDIVTTGPAITPGTYRYTDALTFENQAAITANLSNTVQRAVDLNVVGFVNSGTITAIGGDGVRLASSLVSPLVNSGTIEASGSAFDQTAGVIANSGTIRSTGGVGLKLSNFGNVNNGTNSGTISGATIGVTIQSGQFENTGTISGGTTGVTLGYSSAIINRAGGTISGGSRAIGAAASNFLNVKVSNAGTINGGVDLRSPLGFDSSNDRSSTMAAWSTERCFWAAAMTSMSPISAPRVPPEPSTAAAGTTSFAPACVR